MIKFGHVLRSIDVLLIEKRTSSRKWFLSKFQNEYDLYISFEFEILMIFNDINDLTTVKYVTKIILFSNDSLSQLDDDPAILLPMKMN